ncbi:MAG: IS1182 family transposase [Spirochaetales bacterium]
MPRGKSDRPTFKPYDQYQADLIPPTAIELVPENHLVRVVDDVLNQLDLSSLMARYDKGGGASRYHPTMLLRVWVYAYISKVYSGRQIAKQLRENLPMRWLAGAQTPDFRTLNTFRSSKLAPVIEEVFVSSVRLLEAKGYVTLKTYFVDGTKIEANANKYSFVWGNAVDTFDNKMDQQLRAYVKAAQEIARAEDEAYGDRDLEEMEKPRWTKDDIQKLGVELNRKLATLENKPLDPSREERKKKLRAMAKKVSGDFLDRKTKYEQSKAILAGRKSYSKTDTDATFMRMKEDPMRNGQLKPGYNVQIGTENGFVLDFALFPNPTDTRTLKPHLDQFERHHGRLPHTVVADAGYGGEENYQYLEDNKVRAVVKYNWFHKEQRKAFKKQIYRQENWPYDLASDSFECPKKHKAAYVRTKDEVSESGYKQLLKLYRVDECGGCSVKALCTKGEANRTLGVNWTLRRLKEQAKKLLTSDEGIHLRKRRCVEVEPVFAKIKHNGHFRRFHLRGLGKVKTEWGLLSLSENLQRMALRRT